MPTIFLARTVPLPADVPHPRRELMLSAALQDLAGEMEDALGPDWRYLLHTVSHPCPAEAVLTMSGSGDPDWRLKAESGGGDDLPPATVPMPRGPQARRYGGPAALAN